ncbi:MAG: tetratricopeptide repeat protein [Bacteroidia bacterium]|nr:tetratricopeptide repeat protein [Bacteroidia bacterium]
MDSTRRLAAIMFTDIVGYTALMGHDEERGLDLLENNRKIQKPLIEKFGGQFLKEMGDGILASFDNATSAVICAAAIQEESKKKGINLRIGIHQGEVVFQEGDVFGDGVNIASRIESIANPGQILVSEDVLHSIQNKKGIFYEFYNEVQLKNVAGKRKVYHVFVEDAIFAKLLSSKKTPQKSKTKSSFFSIKMISWIVLFLALFIAGFLFNEYILKNNAVESSIKSLVVLPMDNLNRDTTQDYFSEGMHDALINELSRIPLLRVISRTSAMQFKNTDKALDKIAKELGVDAIVEGTTFRIDNKVRIGIKLIALSPERALLTETFQKNIEDVLLLQDDVASTIAGKIELTIPKKLNNNRPSPKINPEALEMYLKGRRISNALQAIDTLTRAVELDSTYALAYGALAETYIVATIRGLLEPDIAFQKARELASKALILDPNTVEAYTALAEIECHYNYDWEKGNNLLKKALEINPGYATAYFRQAGHFVAAGNISESDRVMAIGRQLAPPAYWSAGYNNYHLKRFRQAIDNFTQQLKITPNDDRVKLRRALCYIEFGELDAGIEELEILSKRYPNDPKYNLELARGFALKGENLKSIKLLKGFLNSQDEIYISPYLIAKVYTGLGEIKKALEALEEAYAVREPTLIWMKMEPAFASLHSEPKFKKLIEKLGLA